MGVLIQNEEDAAMSEKRYQISPIELVQWAEPLFGDEEAPAQGLSPELVTSYEAAAGFQLPAVLREYYLTCARRHTRGVSSARSVISGVIHFMRRRISAWVRAARC